MAFTLETEKLASDMRSRRWALAEWRSYTVSLVLAPPPFAWRGDIA